jgi:hypothetical protein
MTAPHPSRRRFIALVGGGAVLAAAPLAGCSSSTSSPYPAAAVQAWQPVAPDTELRRWMLAHALLAPNPHNRQPWRADLRRDGEITLVCDGERLLPDTDPFGRQILIGCGAFVELAVLAAAERGVRVDVQPFPDGEPGTQELPGGRAVARLVLHDGAARDPLFAQIRRRHTHKGPYDSTRAVAPADWSALVARAAERGVPAGTVSEPGRVGALRTLTREAYRIEMTTERTWLESAHLLRIGPSEIERHRDGISVTGLMPRLMSSVGLFDRFEVPKAGTSNFNRVMERWTPFETGSGYFWLATAGNARRAQFDSGRAYVRAHLQATAAGLEMHPLSQALQEFAEMRGPFDAVHRALGFDPSTHTVQMLARVGHAAAPSFGTPRRELDALITRA